MCSVLPANQATDSLTAKPTTLCPKKVIHQTHDDNFVNIPNGFSKFFDC